MRTPQILEIFSTWNHVGVLGDEMGVVGDEGEEDPGVRGPGHDPDQQEQETPPPETSLHLESLFIITRKKLYS